MRPAATREPGQDFGGDTARHGREMAMNRLLFGLLIAIYFAAGGAGPALLATLIGYMVFALLLYGWLRLMPGRAQFATSGCAMIADLGVISLGMHLDGPGNAALFPLYFWVIQGNGFRFGIKPLFAATALAFAGFAAVAATTPYWRQQPALSASLLAALVALPSYSGALIRRLSRARLAAEEASHAKSMFLAAISHELRTPLNAILGSVSLIEDTPLDEEQRGLFAAMRTGTQALLSLIGSVLNFSRVEAGLMPVAREAVDIARLLIEVRDLVAIQARMKSLRLNVHVGAAVPRHCLGDRVHLHEVLLNLAANAIKFTQSGGVCLSVEVTAPIAGNSEAPLLRFEVSDTGIGIALEAQDRIFEVFSQADPTILDRFGGTGLGLAISRQLVSLMGGSIGVDSRPGRGSSFWFSLPLTSANPGGAPDANIQSAVKAVLLCDDPDLVEPIETDLRAHGMTVRRATALSGLLAAGETSPPEVLFLYRRDPHGDLPSDCALLGRLDPRGAIPRVLLCAGPVPPLPPSMLKRHFNTTLSVAAAEEDWSRGCAVGAAGCPATPPPHRDTAPTRSTSTLHVLVADDNEINRRVIGKILERAGHRISLVEDGLQALDAMEGGGFDLVLMDVNMPGMNGLEATRMFRLAAAPAPHLPILALTADATAETERACLQAGMDACITKPVTPTRLVALIEAMLPAQCHDHLANLKVVPDDRAVTAISEHPRFSKRLPALDLDVLAELRGLGGPAFVNELLEGFVADAGVLIGRIEAAMVARDMTGFRCELHALCSAGANIGAASIRDAATIRTVTSASLAADGPALVRRLRQELTGLEDAWRGAKHPPGQSAS
ncbi:response regulator [Lichenicoccus sp.]|uniref:sensor histidine kinase n=1 Tax=Lichenicoccus sp. TaxID=2781899 RepID=UPI003D09CE78